MATNHQNLLVLASLLCGSLLISGCGKKTASNTATTAAKTAAKQPQTADKKSATGAGGAVGAAGAATETKADAGPQRVFFVKPVDGAEISGPVDAEGKVRVQMRFGVEGMAVRPAGTNEPNTGHHHVIIDGQPIAEGQPVPMDEQHIHYGKGQLEGVVRLTPGKHMLTMQFANYAHLSYGPKMATTIEVTVVESQPSAGGLGDPNMQVEQPKNPEAAAAQAAARVGTPLPPETAPEGADEQVKAAARAAAAAAAAAEAVRKAQEK